MEELCKVSHRPYTTGFYFGRPESDGQVYETSSYIRDYELIGIVTASGDGRIEVSQRNRFFEGDEVEIIEPLKPFTTLTVTDLRDDKGESISVAPHAEQVVTMACEKPIAVGAMLRKKCK